MDKEDFITINVDDILPKIFENFNILEEITESNNPFALDGERTVENIKSAVIKFLEDSGGEIRTLGDGIPPEENLSLTVRGNISINVKRTVWLICALTLDALWTRGIATGTLGIFGLIGQGIGKLNQKNGELCLYKTIAESHKGGTAAHIDDSLHGKICSSKDLNCSHRDDFGFCNISLENIQENLNRMEKIGAIVYEGRITKKWKPAF